MKTSHRPDEQTLELLRQTASTDTKTRLDAQYEFTKALQEPLRQGILVGDIVRGLFEAVTFEPTSNIEFKLDCLAPGTENDYIAYTMPNQGRVPTRNIESDYLTCPTYRTANGIDWLLKHAAAANWPIIQRIMRIFEAGFVKKLNDDGFHTLLGAAVDRNILIYDADANVGQFTKRLVSLMKTTMARNGGGNTASLKRKKLTDMIMSPECVESIRNWGIDQVDEFTRREIYVAGDGSDTLMKVFGVNIHDLTEFGEGQEYQNFFNNQLGAALDSHTAQDVEMILGLDLSAGDSFMMPVRQELEVFNDEYLHREGKAGVYGWQENGFAVLDARDLVLASC